MLTLENFRDIWASLYEPLFVNTSREVQKRICARQAWRKPRIHLECVFAQTHCLVQLLSCKFSVLTLFKKGITSMKLKLNILGILWQLKYNNFLKLGVSSTSIWHLSHLRLSQLLMYLTHEEVFFLHIISFYMFQLNAEKSNMVRYPTDVILLNYHSFYCKINMKYPVLLPSHKAVWYGAVSSAHPAFGTLISTIAPIRHLQRMMVLVLT